METVEVNVRIPLEHIAYVDTIAGLAGVSRNAAVSVMIAMFVATEKAKPFDPTLPDIPLCRKG